MNCTAIETNVKTVDTASESRGDSPLPHELLVVAKGGLDNLAVHYIFRNLNLENGFDDVNTTQSTYKKGLSCVRINFLRAIWVRETTWGRSVREARVLSVLAQPGFLVAGFLR